MQTIITFSIKEKDLFKDIIKILLNDKITVDEIRKQPKQVREVIYKYFYSINGETALTFEDIAKLIVNDADYEYIKNVPAKYFEHYTLTKLHEQDNPIKPHPTVALNYQTDLIKGWNVDYYMKKRMFKDVECIDGRSEVVDFEMCKLFPDLFDYEILAKRFGMRLSPEYFKDELNRFKYILSTLKLQPRKINIPVNWYVNDYKVIKEIFINHPQKRLPENFYEIVENNPKIDDIANLYVEWYLTHQQEFPELMKKASSLTNIFDKGLKLMLDSCGSFNFDRKYITKYMLDYHGVSFSSSDYVIEDLDAKDFDFKDMKTKDCIAFYNKYYKPTKEFAEKVFDNKVLSEDNYYDLNKITYEQLLWFYHKHNNKRQNFYKIAKSAVEKINKEHYAEFYLLGIVDDFNTSYYTKEEHENFVNALLKQQKLGKIKSFKTQHEQLILEPRLLSLQTWDSCNSIECFNYYIENNVVRDIDAKTFYNYFVNNANSDRMTNNFIKVYTDNKSKFEKFNQTINPSNKFICKGLLSTRPNNVIESKFIIDNFIDMFRYISKLSEVEEIDKTKLFKSFVKSGCDLNLDDMIEFCEVSEPKNFGKTWIKYRHENPPIKLWPETPNKKLQEAYKNYVSEILPKEYLERRFYDYMVRNHRTRSTNSTAIYTLFSNNSELKIIFINDDNILEAPAKKRYTIDIPYERVKEFMSEELETNDITTLTTISGGDFEKICGGNHLLDCFVFSDIKNVFKERTPYKHLMPFFLNNLKLKFDVEAVESVESVETVETVEKVETAEKVEKVESAEKVEEAKADKQLKEAKPKAEALKPKISKAKAAGPRPKPKIVKPKITKSISSEDEIFEDF